MLDFEVGFFTKAASGDQTVTLANSSLTPKVLILWTIYESLNNFNPAPQFAIGFGARRGIVNSSGSVSVASSDGANPIRSARRVSDAVLSVSDTAGNEAAVATLVSSPFAAGQFTITWAGDTSGRRIHYAVFGGNAIEDAAVVPWTMPTSTGNKAVTGLGFAPNFLFHIAPGVLAGALPQSAAGASIMASFQAGTTQTDHAGILTLSDDNVSPTVAKRETFSDRSIRVRNSAGTILADGDYTSYDADGFTLNFTTAPATAGNVITLAIKSSTRIFDVILAKPTGGAPATQTYQHTNDPARARAGLFLSNALVNASGFANNQSISFGAGDIKFKKGGVVAAYGDHGVSSSVEKGYQQTTGAAVVMDNASSPIEALATAEYDGDDLLLTWTTNDSQAREILAAIFYDEVDTFWPVDFWAAYMFPDLWPAAQAGTITASGGAQGGGSAEVFRGRQFDSTGQGAQGGGSATVVKTVVFIPSGGAQGGGSAVVAKTDVFAVSGGALGGGSATVAKAKVHVATGGALGNGAASISFSGTLHHVASGGATGGGAATVVRKKIAIASGGAQAGGAATTTRKAVFSTPSGGALAGTAAGQSKKTIFIPTGQGALAGGSGITITDPVARYWPDLFWPLLFWPDNMWSSDTGIIFVASGGALGGGAAVVAKIRNVTGSGGANAGSAIHTLTSTPGTTNQDVPPTWTHYKATLLSGPSAPQVQLIPIDAVTVAASFRCLPGTYQVQWELSNSDGSSTSSGFTTPDIVVPNTTALFRKTDVFAVTGQGGLGNGTAPFTAKRVFVASGGALGTGSAIASNFKNHIASGGALGGTAATISAKRVVVPSGGAQAGGAALITVKKAVVASGGAIAGGAATVVTKRVFIATGGAFGSGSATGSNQTTFVSSGGARGGGAATITARRAVAGSGGAQAGGSATITRKSVHVASGGGVGNGSATQQTNNSYTHMASGGAIGGGSAGIVKVKPSSGSGGALGNGSAVVWRRWNIAPESGATGSGSAGVQRIAKPVSSGGARAGGAAVITFGRAQAGVGGAIGGGQAGVAEKRVMIGSGGALGNGAPTIVQRPVPKAIDIRNQTGKIATIEDDEWEVN